LQAIANAKTDALIAEGKDPDNLPERMTSEAQLEILGEFVVAVGGRLRGGAADVKEEIKRAAEVMGVDPRFVEGIRDASTTTTAQ